MTWTTIHRRYPICRMETAFKRKNWWWKGIQMIWCSRLKLMLTMRTGRITNHSWPVGTNKINLTLAICHLRSSWICSTRSGRPCSALLNLMKTDNSKVLLIISSNRTNLTLGRWSSPFVRGWSVRIDHAVGSVLVASKLLPWKFSSNLYDSIQTNY